MIGIREFIFNLLFMSIFIEVLSGKKIISDGQIFGPLSHLSRKMIVRSMGHFVVGRRSNWRLDVIGFIS